MCVGGNWWLIWSTLLVLTGLELFEAPHIERNSSGSVELSLVSPGPPRLALAWSYSAGGEGRARRLRDDDELEFSSSNT